jgi:hypothetical protein
LNEVAELGVKMKSLRLLVPEELIFQGNPGLKEVGLLFLLACLLFRGKKVVAHGEGDEGRQWGG